MLMLALWLISFGNLTVNKAYYIIVLTFLAYILDINEKSFHWWHSGWFHMRFTYAEFPCLIHVCHLISMPMCHKYANFDVEVSFSYSFKCQNRFQSKSWIYLPNHSTSKKFQIGFVHHSNSNHTTRGKVKFISESDHFTISIVVFPPL